MNKNMWRYAAVTAGFVASGPALAAGLKWLATGEPPRWIESRSQRLREARRGRPEPMPQVLHELELARLADEVQRVRTADRPGEPGQFHRVRATTAAYDDALVQACRTMGLDHPGGSLPLSDSDRYEIETRLMSAGVRW